MATLKQKTKIGMLWNIFEKIFTQGITFVITILLARLLNPSDYGILGVLNIFLAFTGVFVDSGFSRALVQKKELLEIDASTALFCNFGISIILYVILFFASPYIEMFYQIEGLVKIARVFFLILILNSLSVVQTAKFQRRIDFKTIAIINSISNILSGIFGIVFAYLGAGTWSLVIQSVSKSFLTTFLLWIIGKWFPTTFFSKESFKNLFGFGSKLLISGIISTAVNNLYGLLIGKVYKPEQLGYYSKAQQFPEMTAGTLSSVLNNSTFPLLSSLQNDKDELINVFKKLIKISALVLSPAIIGLAILSDTIIITLLGTKWIESADFMFWLTLSYFFYSCNVLNLNLLNAIGRSDLFLKLDLIKIPIIILTLLVTFNISLKAIAIGQFISSFIYFFINTYYTGKLFNLFVHKQLKLIFKYIISSCIMGILVYILDKLIKSNLISLIVCIIAGIFLYILILILLKDEETHNIINIGKKYAKSKIFSCNNNI